MADTMLDHHDILTRTMRFARINFVQTHTHTTIGLVYLQQLDQSREECGHKRFSVHTPTKAILGGSSGARMPVAAAWQRVFVMHYGSSVSFWLKLGTLIKN